MEQELLTETRHSLPIIMHIKNLLNNKKYINKKLTFSLHIQESHRTIINRSFQIYPEEIFYHYPVEQIKIHSKQYNLFILIKIESGKNVLLFHQYENGHFTDLLDPSTYII